MELTDLDKEVTEFIGAIKPIKKGKTTLTPEVVEPPMPTTPSETIVEELGGIPGGMCFTESFKALVVALAEEYIGKSEAKLWLLQQPDCVEVS